MLRDLANKKRRDAIHIAETHDHNPVALANVVASCINWEGQHILLISAYFPNSLKETKVTIKSLRAILNTLKTKRMILAGNFNTHRNPVIV
jgi:hypothetical protein